MLFLIGVYLVQHSILESQSAATYSMSGVSKHCSDHQQQMIDNEDECRIAANSFPENYKNSRNKSMYPKGCYVLRDNNNIYFNTHSTGSKSSRAEQICKGKKCFILPKSIIQ